MRKNLATIMKMVKVLVVISVLAYQLAPVLMTQEERVKADWVSPDVVISQVFGGGGNIYNADYVVLFNRGSSPVNLGGWSLQYTGPNGAFGETSLITILPSYDLQPGQSFLVQESTSPSGAALPTADAVGDMTINGVNGKLALVASSTSLPFVTNPDPSLFVDLVGYGTANYYEGSGAPSVTNTTALQRARLGCTDTGDNFNDFIAVAPSPQNSGSTPVVCTDDIGPSVTGVTPANGSTNVALDATLTVSFDEPVNLSSPWFAFDCPSSGTHSDTNYTGGPYTFTLTPATPFHTGETCTITVGPSGISDRDTYDPPDNMSAAFSWSFTTVPPPPSSLQGTGTATPTQVPMEGTTLLEVTVVPGANPTSTGITVLADLRPIGGTGTQPLYDNGSNGDKVAGDNIFSFFTQVRATTLIGDKLLPVTISDNQDRTASISIALNVYSFTADIVISQMYAGGGARKINYKNDFIELFNRGNHPVSLDGWTISRASNTSSVWTSFALPSGVTLQPGQYYLIKGSSSGDGLYDIPTPDLDLSDPLHGLFLQTTAGKVILSYSNAPLPYTVCPSGPSRMDLLGWGNTVNCFETNRATPPTNMQALKRLQEGCEDTNNNAADFAIIDPYQPLNPRNTASAFNVCPEPDIPPTVSSHQPVIGASHVPQNAVIQVNFSEPVDVTEGWFTISCSQSGSHLNSTYSGGPVTFQIAPDSLFSLSDICTVTIHREFVTDQDGVPDTMDQDYSWGFSADENVAPVIDTINPVTVPEDTPSGPITFNVTDELPASLTIYPTSSNQVIVPDTNFVASCTPAGLCTLEITPAPDQNGDTTITVEAIDSAGLSGVTTFTFTVLAVNDPPTVSAIPDTTTGEDIPAGPLSFTIYDPETTAPGLVLSATSSNTTLIPDANIVIGNGPSPELGQRTVTVSPASNQSGTATITITASDGELTGSSAFLLTVTSLNDPPTISAIADSSVNEDAVFGPVNFTVGDIETPAADLTLTGTSSNTTLVPDASIVFGGSGADRTVTVTPAANQFGTVDITITVSDGELTSSDTFTLTVNGINDPPTISDIPNTSTAIDSPTVPLVFTIGDIETDPGSLILQAVSSDPGLIPDANLVFGGSGANRTITATPAASQTGTATITVTVSDGDLTASDTFDVDVSPLVNTPPTISDIGDTSTLEDTPTAPIAFTVSDGQTDASSLQLTLTSDVPSLVSAANVVFGGSGSNRTAVITPATNQFGTATITITVSDGVFSTSDTFVLTVTSVNDPPTVSDIPDTSVDEGTSTGPIAFTVGDVENLAGVTVTGTSSNTLLVPNANIVISGTGADRTVTITPVGDQPGTATITITATDDQGAVGSDTFVLTVNNINDPPTITDILNTSTLEDTPTNAIPFTVGDDVTPPADLVVTASSSNPSVVPDGNILLGGSGADRTITITPAADQNGIVTITVIVSDGLLTTSNTFDLTVTAVNDAPTISDIPDTTTAIDSPTVPLSFTIGDAETAAVDLLITGSSSDQALIPNANIVFGGSGASRTVVVTPVGGFSGSATITVTVSDGDLTASDLFTVVVSGTNTAPTISDIPDTTTPEDTPVGPIAFTIGDGQTPAADLILDITSTNPALIPTANIVLGGSGADRTLTITPLENQSGSTEITITVFDGSLTASDTFILTVTSVNDLPTITPISDLTIDEDNETGPLAFTIGDVETAASFLTVTGTSSNPLVVPNANILFGGSGSSRTVTVTPAANQYGTVTITINVSDGTDVSSETFVLTINSVNDAPTITSILDTSTAQDTPTVPLAFTISDVETPVANLQLTATSTNLSLVPLANIAIDGTGSDRTITLTPSAGQTGTTRITLTVSDGLLTAMTQFNVDVIAGANTPPTISAISDITINEDETTGPIAFTIGDNQTNPSSLLLQVTVVTSNPLLLPEEGIVLSGTGTDRTLTLTPAADQNGTAEITITVSDGTESTPSVFNLTVISVNDAPTISDILDAATNEDTPTGGIPFSVGDVETPASDLTVTATSSDQSIVADAMITLASPNPDGVLRTVTLTPVPNAYGSTLITVTVSDGSLSDSFTFMLTVNPVNDPPAIDSTNLLNTTVGENVDVGPLSFTISDLETPAAGLLVTGTSSNAALVPNDHIHFGGSGASQTVLISPLAGVSGSTTITITVSDGDLTTSVTFVVTVDATPTISDTGDQTTSINAATSPIPFTIGDADTALASLVVSAVSSNLTVVPDTGITLAGTGASRTITLTPAAGITGSTTITITVADAHSSASDSFILTVANAAPTITAIANQTVNEDTTTTAIPFTIGDDGTALDSLVLTGASSNQTLVTDANIVFGGTGANRTVTITPEPDQNGPTTITITVSDGTLTTSTAFVLRLNPVNDPPTITDILDTSTAESTPTTPIPFTVGDVDLTVGSLPSLIVTATSSNTALVPNDHIVIGGFGADHTLTITPLTGVTGTTTITVTVSDGLLTASDTFVLTVFGVNSAPTITDIADQTIDEDTSTAALAFTIDDQQTPAANLIVSAGSSNTGLVPLANIVLGGAGADRTITITPAANQSGTATITVTVSDGTLSASDTFLLTVNPVNDPPTISDILDTSTPEDTPTAPIPFTVGDVELDPSSLTVSATSSNTALVPDANIVFGGSGANRTLTITPLTGVTGSTTITVTVSDGFLTASDTFVLTVGGVNTAPTITDIPDQTIDEDTSTAALAFTIDDQQTPAANLVVSTDSSNTNLVPLGNIVLGGTGANRTITITPAANQSGTATITVTVSDGALSASDTFLLTVNPVNDAPTITPISDTTTTVDTPTGAIPFTIGDIDTAVGELTLTATSSDTSVVAEAQIVIAGTGADRTVTLTPAPGAEGSTTITITVSDGELQASTSFTLTVTRQPFRVLMPIIFSFSLP